MQRANKQKKRFKEIQPTKSILENNIVKIAGFSIIASISVIAMSFYFSEFSESTTIRDVG